MELAIVGFQGDWGVTDMRAIFDLNGHNVLWVGKYGKRNDRVN